MVIEEIHSYFIYEDRGTIHVEFTLNEGDRDGDYELEIPLEELEELCDLFNEKEWFDYGEDEGEVTTIQHNVDETQLMEGLSIYIGQNTCILDY